LTAGKHTHLDVAVPELQILERLQLGSKVPVAIVGPAVVDAAAFVDRDVRMVERGESLEILRVECRVVSL
jgi:hypothetical protein